jgi:DNA invertase Pin-like site-specific DNA recombinase
MNKTATYARSSKDRSDISIDAQRRALTDLAQQRGLAVVAEFADAVESGKDADRPGFQAMLAALRDTRREWDTILVLDTSRIARRRALAIIFEEDCRKRGVRVIYSTLPDADPITEMLLKSILQAMDEWHSLTSKAKGLSGMAENVRQGWRAGGQAPKGYRLITVGTGAIRDGAEVTKSRLALGDDAMQVRAYLRLRAQNMPRARAARQVGLEWADTTLLGIERNALTYAGHTVWNRHAERDGGGTVGGERYRPRSEWVIQRDTHEALITDDEAETILADLEARRRVTGRSDGKRTYLLTGLMVAPDGTAWCGDAGAYRLGKGARIKADDVEQAVVTAVIEQLMGDEMCASIAAHYRRLAEAKEDTGERDRLARKAAELERKISRWGELLGETTKPAALLRQIEAAESEREDALAQLADMDERAKQTRLIRSISPHGVRVALRSLAAGLHDQPADKVRDALVQIVERVVLDPTTRSAACTLRVLSGDKVASPRTREAIPAYRTTIRVFVRRTRRA